VSTIGPADVTTYVAKRQAEDVANGTINRELAILLRMLRLAYENGKLARVPVIRKLKEAAPREGFFERDQYEAVRRQLKPDLQIAAAIAYTYGWRMRSESWSSNAASSTSRPARCGWTRAPRRTTRAA
jgi:integrase